MLSKILPDAEANVRISTIKEQKDAIIDDLVKKNELVASIEHKRIPDEEQGIDAIVIKKLKK